MKAKEIPAKTPHPNKVKRRSAKRMRIGIILPLVLLVLVVGTIAFSRSTSQANNSAQSSKKKYIATREIIFDEATRSVRKPTAEETEALVDQVSKLTNRTSEDLTVTSQPDGSEKVDLEGRFGGVMLGRANADGTHELRCVMTMEEAAEFLGLEEVTAQEQ